MSIVANTLSKSTHYRAKSRLKPNNCMGTLKIRTRICSRSLSNKCSKSEDSCPNAHAMKGWNDMQAKGPGCFCLVFLFHFASPGFSTRPGALLSLLWQFWGLQHFAAMHLSDAFTVCGHTFLFSPFCFASGKQPIQDLPIQSSFWEHLTLLG